MAKMSKQQSIINCSVKYLGICVKNKIYEFYKYINPAESFYTTQLIQKANLIKGRSIQEGQYFQKTCAGVSFSTVTRKKVKEILESEEIMGKAVRKSFCTAMPRSR